MRAVAPARANIAFPTRYRFGWGRRAELGAEVAGAGISRPLVVTDRGIAALPWAAALLGAGPVIDAISSNPTEPEVLAGVRAARDAGCDGVVAIGGGSPMDAAKVIALLAGDPALPAESGVCATVALGGARARSIRADRILPIAALPTTAGTGSEVSVGAVVSDPGARVKRTVLHAGLMPRAVVADPEVTVGLPASITAATGLDALTHAIEALCAPGYHPMCDAIALEAIRMIALALPVAVATPADPDARGDLMMAASMAAVAFQKGLGLVHAMTHPLGATTDVHHGLANAVLLPHVLDANRAAIAGPCRRALAALGRDARDPVDGLIACVVELERAIGLPDTLPAPDLPVEELARLALAERVYLATNPRPVDAAEVAAIYRKVLR